MSDLCEERKFEISPIHNTPRNPITQVLASGVVKFYVKEFEKTLFWNDIRCVDDFYETCPKTLITQKLVDLYKNEHVDFEERDGVDPIDFGEDPKKILRYLKEDDKNDVPFISKVYVVNDGIEKIEIDVNEPFLLGCLPWKIFDMYYGLVEKDEDFLSPHIPTIQKISNLLYECADLPFDERLDRINGISI